MTWRAFPATEGPPYPIEERPKRRKYIDLDTMGRGYKEDMTVDDLTAAARRLFQQVGGELPLEKEDTSDDAFIDFIGDRLCDFGVPMPIIDEVIVKLGGKP